MRPCHRFRPRPAVILAQANPDLTVLWWTEAVHLADTDGADIVIWVAHELKAQGATLAFARVHPQILALWLRAGVGNGVGDASSRTWRTRSPRSRPPTALATAA
jgi:hypothetical protein